MQTVAIKKRAVPKQDEELQSLERSFADLKAGRIVEWKDDVSFEEFLAQSKIKNKHL